MIKERKSTQHKEFENNYKTLKSDVVVTVIKIFGIVVSKETDTYTSSLNETKNDKNFGFK